MTATPPDISQTASASSTAETFTSPPQVNEQRMTESSIAAATIDGASITRPRKLVVLHWLTVICVVMAATLIITRDEVSGRTIKMWLLEGHRHFGLLVLLLFVVRVALRIRLGKLPQEGNVTFPIRVAAALTHIALYALLLALPLLGWAMCGAMGKPVHFFGFTLPSLVSPDDDLADNLQAWHLDAAWTLLVLVCLHIGAALWHHFYMRDGVLRRMLPRRQH